MKCPLPISNPSPSSSLSQDRVSLGLCILASRPSPSRPRFRLPSPPGCPDLLYPAGALLLTGLGPEDRSPERRLPRPAALKGQSPWSLQGRISGGHCLLDAGGSEDCCDHDRLGLQFMQSRQARRWERARLPWEVAWMPVLRTGGRGVSCAPKGHECYKGHVFLLCFSNNLSMTYVHESN